MPFYPYDFTTFTFYDDHGPDAISVDSSSKVSWSGFDSRDVTAYIRKQSLSFSGNFVHRFIAKVTGEQSTGNWYYHWGLGSSTTVGQDMFDEGDIGDAVGFFMYCGANEERFYLRIWEGGSSYDFELWAIGSLGTDYYVTITRSTNTVTAEIRTTSHVNESGKVTLTAVGSKAPTYSTLYACSSHDDDAAKGDTVAGETRSMEESSVSSSSSSSKSSSSSSSRSSSSSSSSLSSSSSSSSSRSSSSSSSSRSSSSSSSSSSCSEDPNKEYSKGGYADLPGDDSALETAFTCMEYEYVKDVDSIYTTSQTLIPGEFAIQQFKDKHTTNTYKISVDWDGRSSVAPSESTAYFQIYDYDGSVWETLDFDNTTAADTGFTLSGDITVDIDHYYDGSNKVTCRVYQEKI